jgi:hypothetical protein
MDRLRRGEVWDKELAEEMLARIPPQGEGEVRYCVEVMTIMALRLRQSSGREVFQAFFPAILPTKTQTYRANLTLLGGFAFGLLAQECSIDQEWVQKLFEHVQHYQDIIISMSPESCRQLGEYLVTVFKPLTVETT